MKVAVAIAALLLSLHCVSSSGRALQGGFEEDGFKEGSKRSKENYEKPVVFSKPKIVVEEKIVPIRVPRIRVIEVPFEKQFEFKKAFPSQKKKLNKRTFAFKEVPFETEFFPFEKEAFRKQEEFFPKQKKFVPKEREFIPKQKVFFPEEKKVREIEFKVPKVPEVPKVRVPEFNIPQAPRVPKFNFPSVAKVPEFKSERGFPREFPRNDGRGGTRVGSNNIQFNGFQALQIGTNNRVDVEQTNLNLASFDSRVSKSNNNDP